MKRFSVQQKGDLSLIDLIQDMWQSPQIQKAGALASFFGIVRGETHQKEPVQCLSFEAYNEIVERSFARIAQEIKEKYGVLEVFIHHVTGGVNVGDLIMAVLVLGSSRKSVFPALQEAVERVKKEAPIWKKETLQNGESRWIEYEA